MLSSPTFPDASYNGCERDFSLTHALDCLKGGLIIQHYNQVRDALGYLAALGYKKLLVNW